MKDDKAAARNSEECDDKGLTDIYACLGEIHDSRIYYSDDIPEKKLETARWSYAADINPEAPVIALVDNTLWGSCKYGCFFSKSRFYSRDCKFGIRRAAISAQTRFGLSKHTLFINDEAYLTFPKWRQAAIKKLVEALTLLVQRHCAASDEEKMR